MKKSLIAMHLMLAFGTANAANVLNNGSFEFSNVAANSYLYSADHIYQQPVAAPSWVFANNSGVSNGTNDWYGSALDGSSYAFLQREGASISQTFYGGSGLYTIDFSLAQRVGANYYSGAQSINVFLDGNALQLTGQINPSVINAPLYTPGATQAGGWTGYSFALASVGAGQHTLTFQSLGWNNRDTTVFLDNVSVTAPVPEPETYAMLLAGLGLMGVLTRRRNRKQA